MLIWVAQTLKIYDQCHRKPKVFYVKLKICVELYGS
jgi:hypothetical protein